MTIAENVPRLTQYIRLLHENFPSTPIRVRKIIPAKTGTPINNTIFCIILIK